MPPASAAASGDAVPSKLYDVPWRSRSPPPDMDTDACMKPQTDGQRVLCNQGLPKAECGRKKRACLEMEMLWLCCKWASSCKEAPRPHSGTLHCSLCCVLTLMGRAPRGGVARCLSGSTLSSMELYISCLQGLSKS